MSDDTYNGSDIPPRSEEYNGWTNRETWALNLWLSNDRGLYEATLEIAKGALDGYRTMCDTYGWDADPDNGAFSVGLAILDWFKDELPEYMDDYAMMRDDVGSVWRVDPRQLGAAFLEGVRVRND